MSGEAPEYRMESYESVGFDEWVRLVGNRFVPLSIFTGSPETFAGTLRSRNVDGTCVTDIQASSHSVHRLERAIRRDHRDHLKLSLQLEGSGLVMQDGRSAQLEPGDAAIYDTARPYTLEYAGEMRSLVMLFPHSMLGISAGRVHTVTAVRLAGDTGIGRVICPFMQHLAENLDALDGANGSRIMHSAFELITALLSSEIQASASAEPGSTVTFEIVRQYIDEHLTEPELNNDAIARAHFISTRQLQYLFQEERLTVSGYVRHRRLERARIGLEDAAQNERSVLQIAQSAGFVDLSHFSKLFKATYGTSPRDYRLAAIRAAA
ncbi:helix-turn-helix domain-containing protein [Leucobacter allii]|uniref:AraC-like ligand-binding domain-containing protein n=1 Tax=Leucobacter allii TaxID=2932247 RepID=UPI001FD4E40D|nr:helix-turn-helix domain-containing protein [Leucobacter allii]UOR00553.1 helix-turn-helix domain-containing protein [Leucobacter allii]